MRSVRTAALALACLGVAVFQPWKLLAQSPRYATIQEADLRNFMGYIASDTLQGRQTFTEGYGLAAGYVASHLQQWGVKPAGENGTYFQTVKINDVKTLSDNSSVTVEVNGQSKTFKNGEGVRFATPLGGKQTVTLSGAEFLGYALYLSERNDYAGKTVKGKPVIWINGLPNGLPPNAGRIVAGRARHAVAEQFAAASISYAMTPAAPGRGAAPAILPRTPVPGAAPAGPAAAAPVPPPARGRAMVNTVLTTAPQGDFTTPDNFNRLNRPQITGGDEFFELLFTGAPKSFADIKALATAREPLPTFPLPAVKLTFNVDATYQVLQSLQTHNVVGIVEGTDSRLKDTYVLFGSHLDHTGYQAAPRGGGAGRATGAGPATGAAPGGGRCPNVQPGDVINNGADDDGSGVVTQMAIAKAFAIGAKPKRSLMFIWHAGEEFGLYGSRYNADFPVVPMDKIDVQLNMDMIGRDEYDNRDADFRNSVYIVGGDRISTDLHNTVVDVNAALRKPLKLDYGMNDPADPEAVYYRSDHYSYAAKGVPIAFFTTGLHSDYHCASDTADKINYEKMTRIGQLVYQTGFAIANMDKFMERDNLGPRSGKGFEGKIKK